MIRIQLNIVTCPTYADKFIRDMSLHSFYNFPVVIVTPPFLCNREMWLSYADYRISLQYLLALICFFSHFIS